MSSELDYDVMDVTAQYSLYRLLLPRMRKVYRWHRSIIKGACTIFFQFDFVFHLKDYRTKDVNLKFQLNRLNRLDVVSNFAYCRCLHDYYVNFIMVTITRHFFIYIFQTHHILAGKFYMRYGKNGFSYDTKSPDFTRQFVSKWLVSTTCHFFCITIICSFCILIPKGSTRYITF